MFIEILFKMLLFKGGVLIYAEHCIYIASTRNEVIRMEHLNKNSGNLRAKWILS